MKIMFENRKLRFLILSLVPVALLCASLLCLMIRPISLYVRNCSFEILLVAISWILIWGVIFIWKRLGGSRPINRFLVLLFIGITVLTSYPNAKKIAKGRYVFYTQGLYALSHHDVQHIYSAIASLDRLDWESAKMHIDSCSQSAREFFSYSTGKIMDNVGKVDMSIENFEKLLNQYELTPSMLALYESLAIDFGGDVYDGYKRQCEKILEEVNNIDELYEAIAAKDVERCHELIHLHGRYWFEPEVQDMILNSEDCIRTIQQVVMKEDRGEQYKRTLEYAWGI